MASIRRSLTLYFLGLLVLGVGSVSLLADRVMDQTLESRLAASSEAINLRTEERIKEYREEFDNDMLTQARNIGRVMQFQYFHRFERESRTFQVGLVTQLVGAGATGPLPPAVWSVGMGPSKRSPFGPLSGPVIREYFVNLHLDERYLGHMTGEDDRRPEYIQLNTAQGVWRSAGLSGATLPFRPAELDNEQLIEWQFDTVTLPDGSPGRRVTLRSPLTLGWIRVPFPRTGEDQKPQSFTPPPPPRNDTVDCDPLPNIYVHYARPTADLDLWVAGAREMSVCQITELARQAAWDRQRFRYSLGVVGGLALLATVVGGPLLIRRSLNPLRRLTDAVSEVSEKDFRLPVRADQLTFELVPIHARLTATLGALERAFEHEKQAVADLSHELRTPIAALLTTIDVTLRKPREPDQYKATMVECRQIGKQLGLLVERIMTLAWLDSGRDQVIAAPVDARDVAAGCAAVIRPLAEAKGIGLTVDLDDAVEVVTDEGKVREVLMNLLHNAVEYNRPGGTVHLGMTQAPWGGCEIVIRDTGIGMSPENRDRVFERFYRADPSRHATGVHAGLGLAIVKDYVERLRGTIDVASELGVGTTFALTLPASAVSAPARPISEAPSGLFRRRSGDATPILGK